MYDYANMKPIVIKLSLFIFGGISFLVGLFGFYRLYDQSNKTIHTEGIVTHLEIDKKYIRGKARFENYARIQYETERYTTNVNMKLHNPFVYQGSRISVWYYPDQAEKVILPSEESIFSGGALGLGAFFLFLGVLFIKK